MDSPSFSKDFLTFTATDDVCKLIKPFTNCGFTAFDYVRVYKNSLERIHLGNNLKWLHFFYDNLYILDNLYFEQHWSNEINYWTSYVNMWGMLPDQGIIREVKDNLNISQGITIAFSNIEYNEYFYLGMENDNTSTAKMYLNNISEILKYCFLFKDVAISLVKNFEKNKIIAPSVTKPIQCYDKIYESNTSIKQVERYYIGDIYITKREKDIISWIAKGKTSEEIGMILNISSRTVNVHIENVKTKLGCSKITRVVYLLTKYGVL